MIKITIAEEFVSVCVRRRRKTRRIQPPRRRDCISEPGRLGSQSSERERRISAALFTFWSLKRFLLEKPPQRQDSASLIRGATVSTARGNVCRQTKHKISGLIRSESSVYRWSTRSRVKVWHPQGRRGGCTSVRFQLKRSHILLNFHISLRSREEVKWDLFQSPQLLHTLVGLRLRSAYNKLEQIPKVCCCETTKHLKCERKNDYDAKKTPWKW